MGRQEPSSGFALISEAMVREMSTVCKERKDQKFLGR